MQATNNDALRITNQFRSKGGMAYDLKCEGVRLALFMVQRTNDADPGEWRVEARVARTSADFATVVEWGKTRGDALRAVGTAWTASNETLGLRVFDWDAVAKVLDSVKAFR
jgi:hypothetical protein